MTLITQKEVIKDIELIICAIRALRAVLVDEHEKLQDIMETKKDDLLEMQP